MHLEIPRIPAKHIMKRWTMDARDILASSLIHYQKAIATPKSLSIRHSRLYLKTLELVKMGDYIAAFDAAMDALVDALAKVTPIALDKDGLGLAEKELAARAAAACIEVTGDSGVSVHCKFSMGLVGAPFRDQRSGKPNSSREKP